MLLEVGDLFLPIVEMEKPRPRDVTVLVWGTPHPIPLAWEALRACWTEGSQHPAQGLAYSRCFIRP